MLTEDWIIEAWKHRNEINFNVNDEEFVSIRSAIVDPCLAKLRFC